jgi:uncharacterized membrane protein YsdA (DUF1294 family)/cold shock CspA family protein
MRTKGKITFWKDEKGFGFITPSSGEKQVFVHTNSFINSGRSPRVGQLVEFSLSTDRQGRPCAIRVTRPREKLPRDKRNDKRIYVLGAVFFLIGVGLAVLAGALPFQVLLVYLVASAITYAFYSLDKSAARSGAWRTQETTLHGLSLIGGWPGALIAQQILRHKSKKEDFRFVFWLTVVINIGVFLWLFTASGSDILQFLTNQ